jgi:hypothetical protein
MHITTSYDHPPIPDRSMDWSAIDSDTYDCDCDQDGFYSLSPIGRGATEADAVADLREQLGLCPRCGEGTEGERPDGCRDLMCP